MQKQNRIYTFIALSFCLSVFITSQSFAQECMTFNDSPKEKEGLEAHVLYRDAVKAKNFDDAFANWQKAYEIAPAADGQRPFHFTDGRDIFKHKLKNAADDTKKKEYVDMIVKLYDQQIKCYGEDGEEGRLLGRKAFDMFYTLRTPYPTLLSVLEQTVEKAGNDAEYIIFVPYATVVEYLFTNEKMDKMTARNAYIKLNEIADYNIANNEKFGQQYQQAAESMNAIFGRIEDYIFDCEYFVKKLQPDFDGNADNPDYLEDAIRTLKKHGCVETEPFLVQLEGKWSKYAAAENARRQAEFEANNPAFVAKELYDKGDFKGAIAKYEQAIAEEADPTKQASYYFSIASIQYRKLNAYSTARETARKAASLRSGWGRPYMLIGDMYGSSARNCGDSWNQRLAILAAMDKYSYAKSIDGEVASDANSRLSKYRASMPDQEEGFMRGKKEGDTVKVGCWIGESVKVRFK